MAPSDSELEAAKLAVESKRLDIERILLDSGIKERLEQLAVEAKALELEIEKEKRRASAVQKGILVALIGVLATLLGSVVQGTFSILHEKEKLESALIQQATDTTDPAISEANLRFLVATELVTNKRLKKRFPSMTDILQIPARRFVIQNESFDVDNEISSFAVKGYFTGKWSLLPDEIAVVFDRASIHYPTPNPAGDQRQWIASVSIGLAEQADGLWSITAESPSFSVARYVEVGQQLVLGSFDLKIPLEKGRELVNRWIVVNIVVASREGQRPGLVHVHFAPIRDPLPTPNSPPTTDGERRR